MKELEPYEVKNKLIQFKCGDSLYDAILIEAKKRGMKTSYMIRQICQLWIDECRKGKL